MVNRVEEIQADNWQKKRGSPVQRETVVYMFFFLNQLVWMPFCCKAWTRGTTEVATDFLFYFLESVVLVLLESKIH